MEKSFHPPEWVLCPNCGKWDSLLSREIFDLKLVMWNTQRSVLMVRCCLNLWGRNWATVMLPDGGLYFCQKKKMLVRMKTVQDRYIRAQIWLWISTLLSPSVASFLVVLRQTLPICPSLKEQEGRGGSQSRRASCSQGTADLFFLEYWAKLCPGRPECKGRACVY